MVKLKLVKDAKNPEDRSKWSFETLEKGSKESQFYMDGKLKTNLDAVKKIIRKNWDYVFVVDGEVGAGKSVFAQQLCYYVSDGDFEVDEITFKPEEFREQVLKSGKYNGVIFDEAFRGMSARAAMTQTNRVLMSMLQEIRQRNLFIFIVLPSIWDLDKYVALHRCKGLFHVHTDENKQRGFFKFYNNKQLMNLLKDYKLKYKYPFSPKFKGRFTEFYPLGEDEYVRRKEQSLKDYSEKQEKEDAAPKLTIAQETLKGIIKEKARAEKRTEKEICKQYGLNYGTYRSWQANSRDELGFNL